MTAGPKPSDDLAQAMAPQRTTPDQLHNRDTTKEVRLFAFRTLEAADGALVLRSRRRWMYGVRRRLSK